MRSIFVAGVMAIGVTMLAVSASAHHAHGNYALETVDFEGVVTEVHLLNPHSWMYVEVTKDGKTQVWALEGGGKNQMTKLGITPEYDKTGDKVKVRCHPLSDQAPGCLLGFVKTQDGNVKDWDGGATNTLPKDF